LTDTQKIQPSTTILSPDSIEASTSSSSSSIGAVVAPPSDIPSEVLPDQTSKPLPPTHLELIPDKTEIHQEKTKDSPVSNTDHDEDTSEIKTPPMTPRSPVAPMPTILELNVPPSKSISGKLTIYI